MSTPDSLMSRLRGLDGVVVEEGNPAWTLRVVKSEAVRIDIVVPKGVVEWFVTAYDAEGNAIWSDWMDYLGYEPSSTDRALVEDMCKDLDAFMADLVAATEFRVTPAPSSWVPIRAVAEWRIGGHWTPVSLVAKHDSSGRVES
jgi:hypothetical protein